VTCCRPPTACFRSYTHCRPSADISWRKERAWTAALADHDIRLKIVRLDEGRKLNVIKISVLLLTGKLGTVCQYVWCWGYGLYDRRIGVRFPEWEDICLFPRGSRPALGPTPLKPYMIGRFFWRGWPGCKAYFHLYLILSVRMSGGITTTPP